MLRWARFAMAYAFLGVISVAVALVWRSGSIWAHPAPWLHLDARASHTYSSMLGLALGAVVVLTTRASVARFEWARRLHRELSPIARSIDTTGIVVLAILSSLGEELLFRGLLQPWLGLVPQALLFGFLHQIRGPSRWVWVIWASVVGLLLGATYALSGSLVGPIVAHAVINGVNLFYLKSHDTEPSRRTLGGLFSQRS